MKFDDILVLSYAKKIDESNSNINCGNSTYTENDYEETDKPRDRFHLGTQTRTNVRLEGTDADKQISFGTQTVTKKNIESTDVPSENFI